ncbi:hypothetical protein BOX15_Mlig029967g1 [Macrostomum lignano]|uniref:Uncharacterized protein n=2 Tax=Macrostomum lignano TaxID=282301 RepID=A0A267ERX5_9PLAT|nr:hypothetical protein BOX15_Mlig023421g1 [Macrostomum lignano]PAA63512.1 hypothetical protein BOX15_Mlig029967g1 [Macrostomum lignano]
MNTVVAMHLFSALELLSGLIFFPLLFYICVSFLRRYKDTPIWKSRTLSDIDCYDISIKIVTAVYSLMTFAAGLISVLCLRNNDLVRDRFWLVSFWVCFGFGYYAYDSVMKPYCFGMDSNERGGLRVLRSYSKNQPMMLTHHLLIMLVYYPTLLWFRNGKCDFLVGCFFLAELTVPFIQIRHIMYRLGMTSLPQYLWNGVVMVITFFLSRIVVLFYIYYAYAQYRGVPVVRVFGLLPLRCNIGMLALISMQLYWFGLMLKKFAKYVYSNGKEE